MHWRLQGIRTSEGDAAVILPLTNGQTLNIVFVKGSSEEQKILRELHDIMIGQKIGIIQMGKDDPIRIRKILVIMDRTAPF